MESEVAATPTDSLRWTDSAILLLALWLFSSPFTMGYLNTALTINDLLCSVVLGVFAIWNLFRPASRFTPILRLAMGALGIWLTFAPLVFWAPTAGAYANGNLIGILVVCLSVIAPSVRRADDPKERFELPPGWSYNPSSWGQRAPIIGLAFLGYLMARYLAAFQLGHINSAWDPFFAEGTETILTSDISRAFPVSDAGLGAWSYILDALAGSVGATARWRRMPWIVILFGLMIIPPGVTSIVLVMLQPIGVGAWCTICLATAFIMLLMVPPAIDEVVVTVQYLRRARKQGLPLWRTFWAGGGPLAEDLAAVARKPSVAALNKGLRLPPWNLILSTLIGAVLMFLPSVYGLQGFPSDSTHIVGALVITFAIIACSEVARPLRFLNALAGVWLIIAPWFFSLPPSAAGILFVCGLLLVGLSIPLGRIRNRHGAYDLVVNWAPWKAHPRAART